MTRFLSRRVGLLAVLLSFSLAACEQTSITGVDALEPAAASWSKGKAGVGGGPNPSPTPSEPDDGAGIQSDFALAFP